METFEKKEYISNLYLIYKDLLTKKQTEYLELYYINDYSLQEIADIFQITRSAVFDNLKKVVKNLNSYEEKLNLYKNYLLRKELLDQFEKTNDKKYLDELRKLG